MELVNTGHKEAVQKKYRRYSVSVHPETETPVDRRTEFFYIGDKISAINNLVNLFDGGYATKEVSKAISIFNKLIETKNTFPAVIIADAGLNNIELETLHNFLSAKQELQDIPLIADISHTNDAAIDEMRKILFIDDMVSLNNINEKFISRIKFIATVKDRRNRQELQRRLDESVVFGNKTGRFFRRVFDIIVSSVLLILFSPIILLVALVIKLESKGPLLYISKRAGRGYSIFSFYKFRTMEQDADKKIESLSHLDQYKPDGRKEGVFFKVDNDPRITKLGSFLRNTSLDELPQLVNVFLGHMSLVGNRPLPLYEAATLTTKEYAERFMAPAGITGLWQVQKRGQKEMSAEERIHLDLAYAHRNNFLVDLRIIAKTPTVLFQKASV